MIYYMMLILATLCIAFNFVLNKLYQRRKGTSPKAAFLFNSILGIFSAIIYFTANGFKLDFTPYSFVMTTLYSVFVMSYTIIGFKLLKCGTMAVYTLFLMVGGMAVPYIFGVLVLNEGFSCIRTIALLVIMSGVVLSNYSGEKMSKKRLLMCIAVFILNGLTSVASKVHQINIVSELGGFANGVAALFNAPADVVFRAIPKTDFVIISGMVRFVTSGIMFLVTKEKKDEGLKKTSFVTILLIIAGSAALSGLGSILQLEAAINLPASVLYPFTTGGTIIFSALAGICFFKEKVSWKTILSIFLCFVGTLMFL